MIVTCPICRRELGNDSDPDNESLHGHLDTEHGYRKCDICQVSVYIAPDSFQQHMERNHSTNPSKLPFKRSRQSRENVTPKKFKSEEDENFNFNYKKTSSPMQHSFSKDPLRGFFLQTVLECLECPERPSKKFSFFTSWQLHLKTHHKDLANMADYKEKHGDPDLVHFKHTCRLCDTELKLNQTVMKRHLALKHKMTIGMYLDTFREELMVERKLRPSIRSSHTLDGWWEGCHYCCQLCSVSISSLAGFENHLSSVHGITGQHQIQEEYVSKFGKICSTNRVHDCYICNKVIKHDHRVIIQHLSKHRMDLETYTSTYKAEIVEELRDKEMEYILTRDSDASGLMSVDDYLSTKKKMEECFGRTIGSTPRYSNVEEKEIMESWYDCSEHKCALCGQSFWSNLRFHWHIKREHKLVSTRDYRRLHGDPELRLRQHKCKLCGSLIKWEASRIRDHLKSHKVDKMTLKEYGSKFRTEILEEVKNIKGKSDTLAIDGFGDKVKCEKENEFSAQEWKDLLTKKKPHPDKVECKLCDKKMNRHSLCRHQDRTHRGLLNMRDLERLKKKQLTLASSGVFKSLGELLQDVGGVAVVRGQRDHKQVIDVQAEESQVANQDPLEAGNQLNLESKTEKGKEDEASELEVEAVTYVVDGESGEIIMIDKDVKDTIELNEEFFDTESVTGPLDGQIMEIDSSARFEEGNLNEDVKIIVIAEENHDGIETPAHASSIDIPETEDDNQSGIKEGENIVVFNGHNLDSVGFVVENEVLDKNFKISEDSKHTVEDNLISGYLYVSDDSQVVLEQENDSVMSTISPAKWSQLGADKDYEPKLVSKARLEASGRVSEGTVVCQWTKLAGDRVRVSTSKLITPSEKVNNVVDTMDRTIADPVLYSLNGQVYRDLGCQITFSSRKVNGVPTNKDEEELQAERIRKFLAGGGVIDRVCPGCEKTMSRTRNLVSHIQVIHGVEVKGVEREEHDARHTRENIRVTCEYCNKVVSRKSIKRHINLFHRDLVQLQS